MSLSDLIYLYISALGLGFALGFFQGALMRIINSFAHGD